MILHLQSTHSLDIIQPDITEILGAFSAGAAPSILPGDQRVAKYNIISGTSVLAPMLLVLHYAEEVMQDQY
ncbi:hypothetical protein QYF36_001328 [Acer negundo]|nr:hypothetical protein QYF36_001328 [Acer negundo]